MARWTDLARWRGPSPNIGAGDQNEHRGLVVHIADGWFEGTISWQRNNDSNISSHFVVGRDGQIAQMVDTSDAAWTQRSGNGEWLSVECEGFTKGHRLNPGGWERLSDKQIDAVARILLKCHQVYSIPLQVISSATGRGLGHHSMDPDWGHQSCPGAPIIAQKPAIVARAVALKNGNGDDDMPTPKELWHTDGLIDAPSDAPDRKTNPYWAPASALRGTLERVYHLPQDVKAIKAGQAAILAAVKGLDTKAVIAAVNAAAAADATRDAELLAELRDLASGGATAQEIVDQLAARLSSRAE
jgi:hypothetical protein